MISRYRFPGFVEPTTKLPPHSNAHGLSRRDESTLLHGMSVAQAQVPSARIMHEGVTLEDSSHKPHP